jgi:PAS domain S-box-containing protein
MMMVRYEKLTRDELIALARDLKNRLKKRTPSPRRNSARFPVFGERERREFEASFYPIRIFDRETFRYLAVNDAALRLYGYSRDEFLRLTPLDTRHPDEHEDFYRTLAEPTGYLRHRGPRRHVTKSGAIIVVEIVMQDILYEGREARLSLTLDVTERVRMEEELRRQKNLLGAIIEHLPVGVAVKDARTGRYVLRNRVAETLTGFRNAEAIGKRADEVYPLDLATLIDATDREALERGMVARVSPQVIRRHTGRRLRYLKVPVPDERGHHTHLVSIIEDLTDIETAKEDLCRSEERLRQLVALSPAVIFSFSPTPPYPTTWISENVTAQLGWQPSDFTADPAFWRDGIHPEDRDAALAKIAEIATKERYECEYRFRHRNGSWRWMHDEGRLVRDADGGRREAIGVWMDVTAEREAAEERMRRVIEQRDALVKEVHHRIKNHLQGIAGLLREKKSLHPELASLIDPMVAQIKSVALAFGLQSGAGTLVAPGKVLEAICASLENLMPCRIVRKWISARSPRLYLASDETVPTAVALNELLFNAVKHGKRSAGVTMVELDCAEHGHKVEIRISNHGELPPGFDYRSGTGCATGLGLVKTLLGPQGSTLAIWTRDGRVETVLTLEEPVVVTRPRNTRGVSE